jgi:hypothetical protein
MKVRIFKCRASRSNVWVAVYDGKHYPFTCPAGGFSAVLAAACNPNSVGRFVSCDARYFVAPN